MTRLLSLRGVISTLAALSVATVAIITLTLTLTTSLSTLRDIGKDNALSLLTNAQLSTQQLLQRPQDTIRAMQNFARMRRWAWPSDDPATADQFMTAATAASLQEDMALQVVLYFADNTKVTAVSTSWSARYPYDYFTTAVQRASSYTAANFSSDSQTLLSYDRETFHIPSMAPMPETDPLFDTVNRVYAAKHRHNFLSFDVLTVGGTVNVNFGIVATRSLNFSIIIQTYCGAIYRQGDPMGASSVYGYAFASISYDQIDGFLRASRETPNTEAFAIDGIGYLMGSSMAKPYTRTYPVASGAFVPVGCSSTETSGTVTSASDLEHICRTHASDYGFGPLAAVMEDRSLAFTPSRVVVLKKINGEYYFAAAAPVPQSVSGRTTQLILLMPEADVIGDVVRSRNTAIGVTCAVFVVVATLIFVAISLLLAPLSHVAERMHRASNFEDDEADASVSTMAEVAELQEAYYAMNDELKRIRAFVPQSVLAAKHADAADAEEAAEAAALLRAQESLTAIDDTASQASRSSCRSHRSAASNQSGIAGGPVAGHDVLGTAVTLRPVGVLIANARGFSNFASKTGGPSRMAEAVAALVDHIHAAITASGGVLGGFHGDHFTATFNAVTPCFGFSRKAVAAAMQIAGISTGSGAERPKTPSDAGNHHPLHLGSLALPQVTCGVATGNCSVGNVGSDAAKGFATVGPAFMQAVVLERLTRVYSEKPCVLTTARVCAEVGTTTRTRFVDIVDLPGKRAALVAAILGPIHHEESGTANAEHNATDEWLYVVGANDASDVNAVHNQAFSALHQLDLDTCGDLLASMKHPPVGSNAHEPPASLPNAVDNVEIEDHDGRPTAKDAAPSSSPPEATPGHADARLEHLYNTARASSTPLTSPPTSAMGHFFDDAVVSSSSGSRR